MRKENILLKTVTLQTSDYETELSSEEQEFDCPAEEVDMEELLKEEAAAVFENDEHIQEFTLIVKLYDRLADPMFDDPERGFEMYFERGEE